MTEPSPWLDRPPYGLADHVVARLRQIAEEVAAEWGLSLGPRIAAGRYSYVTFVGDDAVLKVIPAEDDQADHVIDALNFWNGDGAVRLLRSDERRRALLMERLLPGTEASEVPEDEAIAAAIAVGRRIWRTPPPAHRFRTIDTLVRMWLEQNEAQPLIATARAHYERIVHRNDVLVHADLHHHNLLRRGHEWVTIDPQPFVGEPEFDIPAFLWNPLSTEPTRERTTRRVAAFARAGLDAGRIREWAIVRGICNGVARHADEDPPQLRVAKQLL